MATDGGMRLPDREKRRAEILREVCFRVSLEEASGRVQESAGVESGGGWSGKYSRCSVRGDGGRSESWAGGDGGGEGGEANETVFLATVLFDDIN